MDFPMLFPWVFLCFDPIATESDVVFPRSNVPNLAMLGAETDAKPAVPEFQNGVMMKVFSREKHGKKHGEKHGILMVY